MYQIIADNDSFVIETDLQNGKMRVSYFEDYHWKNELIMDISDLINSNKEGEWYQGDDGRHYCSVCHNSALYDDEHEEVLGWWCPYCNSQLWGRE